MQKVHVVYKNKDLEVVAERDYDLDEYMDILNMNLLRIITDVEDFLFSINEGKKREEWPREHIVFFNTVKHKLLDEAGNVKRLPKELYDTQDAAYDFWKGIFGADSVRKV